MIPTMATSNTEQIPINKLIVLGSQVLHGILYLIKTFVHLSCKCDSNFMCLLSTLKTNSHEKCIHIYMWYNFFHQRILTSEKFTLKSA